MALDYGNVRTGIAVTDPLQLIASGLTTIATPELFSFLKEYIGSEGISVLVVGEPRQMDNSPSEAEKGIRPFIEKFEKSFPGIPVHRQDERFTSKEAVRSMVAAGVKKKGRRDKARVDEISATLILQGYLDRIK